jgi:NAD+ diphosphatase
MIQDIFPHSFNNHFDPDQKPSANDFIFNFDGNSVLLRNYNNEIELPRRSDLHFLSPKEDGIFLFALDNNACFLIIDKTTIENVEFKFEDISFFRTTSKQEIAWACIAALHLKNWYEQNKFCGKCGKLLKHKADERALQCGECGNVVYPKISPAVIVSIVCGDKILLARNSIFPGAWFSLIAGFVDVGETLEETVVREVKEETGLDVKNIRYYKSQPWPLSSSLMIGFVAEADDSQQIVIDKSELTEVAWFNRGSLPEHPRNISIAGEMIEKFELGLL